MNLTGQLLVAMPGIDDSRFARSVILVCAHGEDHAMGIVLNKPLADMTLPDMLEQLEIPSSVPLPTHAVLEGGPVGKDRGFVLHSDDRSWETASMAVSDGLKLTATRDALHAIASEDPPEQWLLAVGYSGWGPGQLEEEIAQNAWLTTPANEQVVFGSDHDRKWQIAMESVGGTLGHMTGQAGQA